MLECRFEILQIVPHPNNLHIWICIPNKRDQYNNVLVNDTYLVAVVKELFYIIFGRWISWANLHNASFTLLFCLKTFLQNFRFLRVELTPIHYILARHVVLGKIQQSQNNRNHHPLECMALSSYLRVSSQVLKNSKTVMRFFHTFHD
jgi:hypothetical protein